MSNNPMVFASALVRGAAYNPLEPEVLVRECVVEGVFESFGS